MTNPIDCLQDSFDLVQIWNRLAKAGYVVDIEQRSGDFLVYVNGDKAVWECGDTRLEAIQKMAMRLEAE